MPIGFAALVYLKHVTSVGFSGWKWVSWLEYGIACFIVSLLLVVLPILYFASFKRSNNIENFLKHSLRTLLIGTVVWVTYPLY